MKGPPEATERVLELLTGPYGLPKGSLRLPGSSERMKGPSKRLKRRNAVPCIFYTVLPWGPFKISGGDKMICLPPSSVTGGGGSCPSCPPHPPPLVLWGLKSVIKLVSPYSSIHFPVRDHTHVCHITPTAVCYHITTYYITSAFSVAVCRKL